MPSELALTGLHHITAITGNTGRNVRFYTEVLGLRLVKQTVNQDDVSAYHLFYGDQIGHAGTEVTFFDFPGAYPNRPGSGMISEVGLRVPQGAALEWWRDRLATHSPPRAAGDLVIVARGDRQALPFADPDGLRLALIADSTTPADRSDFLWEPWAASPIPPEYAIRGLGSITVLAARAEPTAQMLTEVMGFREVGRFPDAAMPETAVTVYATGAGGLGTEIHLIARPDLPRGIPGVGGVHHAAFRTPDDAQQVAWQRHLLAVGIHATQIIDRFYFHSVYFREPGHALFEIATDGPGFAADEAIAHLGERLALPPFLEPERQAIEAGLHPLMAEE